MSEKFEFGNGAVIGIYIDNDSTVADMMMMMMMMMMMIMYHCYVGYTKCLGLFSGETVA